MLLLKLQEQVKPGKGFSVVAEQVRILSSNTSQSAEDIVKYVAELRESIDSLASAMDETTLTLGEGNKKVEQSLAAHTADEWPDGQHKRKR